VDVNETKIRLLIKTVPTLIIVQVHFKVSFIYGAPFVKII